MLTQKSGCKYPLTSSAHIYTLNKTLEVSIIQQQFNFDELKTKINHTCVFTVSLIINNSMLTVSNVDLIRNKWLVRSLASGSK